MCIRDRSCISSLGDPIDYRSMVISLRPGMQMERDELCQKLVTLQYERNDVHFVRNKFRVHGDVYKRQLPGNAGVDLAQKVHHLPFHRAHRDDRVQQSGGTDDPVSYTHLNTMVSACASASRYLPPFTVMWYSPHSRMAESTASGMESFSAQEKSTMRMEMARVTLRVKA